jgi:hypothetical protein
MVKGLLNLSQKQRKKYLEKLNKDKSLKKKQKEYLKYLKLKKHNRLNWSERRTYRDYDILFSQFLKGSLIEEIIQLNKNKINKKEKLKIIEDGSGTGLFLIGLKKLLNEQKIKSELTALSFNSNSTLKEAKRHKLIDKVRTGAIETFIPKEYYDIVFSVYGGVHYALDPLKKEFLLKYSYSLNKGGMAFIALDINKYSISNTRRDIRGDIISFFRKTGFYANFFENKNRFAPSGYQLPKDVLIIKRL